MKRIFALLLVLAASLGARAASVTLESLEPRQFATNGAPPHTVFLKMSSPSTPGDSLYLTNVFVTNGVIQINGTNVPTINPTVGYVPYNLNGTNFGDSPLYRKSATQFGFNSTDQWLRYSANDFGLGAFALNTSTNFQGQNIAIGSYAGYQLTNGYQNVLIGASAGSVMQANDNVAVGGLALQRSKGDANVGIGTSALNHTTTGQANVAAGYLAADQNTTGSDSVAIGYGAANLSSAINRSVIIGYLAATNSAVPMTNAVVIGAHALYGGDDTITIGNTNNTLVIFPIKSWSGTGSNFLTDAGIFTNKIPYIQVGSTNEWQLLNVVIDPGVSTNLNFTVNGTNYFIGAGGGLSGGITMNPTDGTVPYRVDALTLGDSPWYVINTNSVGFGSSSKFLTYDENTGSLALGYGAGYSSTGDANWAIGVYALHDLQAGDYNIAIGKQAGQALTNGSYNVMIGAGAKFTSKIGSYNIAIGDASLSQSTNDNNVAIGSGAALSPYSSSESIFIGTGAGNSNSGDTYEDDVFIGAYANFNQVFGVVTNAVVIGARASVTNSNEIVIGNANNTKAYLPPEVYAGGVLLGPGGSGGGGNMTNNGASVQGMIPVYTDTTGTQLTPTNTIPALTILSATWGRFAVSTNYDVALTNYYISLTAVCTNTLPSAASAGEGKSFKIKALAGGGEIWCQNGDSLDNVTNIVLPAWSAREFISDGTNRWEIN